MSGGGMGVNGVSSTGTGTPGLSGGNGLGLGAGAAGLGGSGMFGKGVPNYSGPVTTADQQGLNQMTDLLRNGATTLPAANSPMVSQPPPAQPLSANDTITSYYQNILQRAPDQAGLEYWNKQAQGGMGLDAIKQSFLNSQEFTGSKADQDAYAKYIAAQQQPVQQVQQPAAPVWTPTVAGVGNQAQTPVFNAPTITQSGGEGSGGAINYQYRTGGIASLLGRR